MFISSDWPELLITIYFTLHSKNTPPAL